MTYVAVDLLGGELMTVLIVLVLLLVPVVASGKGRR